MYILYIMQVFPNCEYLEMSATEYFQDRIHTLCRPHNGVLNILEN